MKTMFYLIVVSLLLLVTWKVFSKYLVATPLEFSEFETIIEILPEVEDSHPQFTCDGRVYCSEMSSREEAEFFINNCPNTKYGWG